METSCAKVALAFPSLRQIGAYPLKRLPVTADSYNVQERDMSGLTTDSGSTERLAAAASDFGSDVVARDPAMLRVLHSAKLLARYSAAVLITGETGSGKEVVARTIHRFSTRSSHPWIDVNCAALPEHLVESELFGHEKGAFSGADTAKPGLFEMASGGTLFLDEIGEVDPRVQVKLLRVLDSAPFFRLGGTRKVSVDVRLIAATNRDLKAAVEAGTFRRDLYHRITECQIAVPPLREHLLDIPALALHFLGQIECQKTFSEEALELMSRMNWPGNVRELRNVVTKLAISAPNETITADDVQQHGDVDVPIGISPVHAVSESATTLVGMERLMMVRALEATGGNQSRAAQQMGMPRRTFCRKLDEYQITLGRRRSGELAACSMLASHRVEFHAPVQVVTNSGLRFAAEATDVSAGGIGLRSAAEPLVVGEEIRLRFSLPLHETPVCVTAAVAWRRADGSAGAQFTRIAAAHRHALLRWLSGTTQHHIHHDTHAYPHQISA
jgi:two-component system, NtrC family, response regulator AtoC